MLQDESASPPPDPQADRALRFIFTAIFIVGFGFMALEFAHWLAQGGWVKFLYGLVIGSAVLLFFALFSQFLSAKGRSIRKYPVLFYGLALIAGLLLLTLG